MVIFRWYQSRAFWIGLAGLLMLTVAVCHERTSRLSVGIGMMRYYVGLRDGILGTGFVDHAYGTRTPPSSGVSCTSFGDDGQSAVDRFHIDLILNRWRHSGTEIDMRGVIAFYLVAWTSAFVWWQRRKRWMSGAWLVSSEGDEVSQSSVLPR